MAGLWLHVKRLVKLIKLLGISETIHFISQWIKQSPLIEFKVRGINTPLFCRLAGSDIHTLWQIHGRHECDIRLPSEPRLIVDGGANIGYTSVYFANKYPNSMIIAVEPDQGNCALFRKNCHAYPNIQLLQGAIWITSSQLIIENPDADSWAFRVTEAGTLTPESFRGITISDIIAQSGMHKIDLLKLDIEGSEKPLFSSGYNTWLPQVRNMMIELHDQLVEGCSKTVMEAVQDYNFAISRSGEYFVFIKKECD